jgi:hypothetical protein
MACLLAVELVTLRFAMRTLSAVRAFVGGEGSWSKAQKNAALSLDRYSSTRNEADYQEFLSFLKVQAGDHQARTELMKPQPDLELVREGFLAGEIHPDDIQPMVELLRRFSWVSYLAGAIHEWARADELLVQFRETGEQWHQQLSTPGVDPEQLIATRNAFHRLNEQLTLVENAFSSVLGEGSRWLDSVVVFLLVLAVLTVETVGLTLTFMTTRALSRGLKGIQRAAERIGAGDFTTRLPVRSADEIGILSDAINQMGYLLERSYSDLERRVHERTAELEKMALENARLYEEAASAVKVREEFFSIASHELRTPMTALHLQHRMLQKSLHALVLPAEQSEKIEAQMAACLRQTTRLVGLASNLLDLTKVRLGKLELNRERSDLVALTRDAIAQLQEEATKTSTRVELHAEGPVVGDFDTSRMTQVAVNLLSNAIKYGKGQPVDLTVTELPGQRARVAVRDRGHGIAPEDHARIFERFERAESDALIPGLGLGLYVSRQIVLAHGGHISVASAVGEGTTFTVDLPLTAPAA